MKGKVTEHDQSLLQLTPAIEGLTVAVDRLHDRNDNLERMVDRHVNKAVGAIAVVGAAFVMVCSLLTYIYLTDQRATERVVMSLVQEHKVMQDQQARSAAERELLFKALLKIIDGKKGAP